MGVKLLSVETTFGEALEIPSADERASFLDRACAGDGDLRRQVEALLDAHFRAGQFLESPAPNPTMTVIPSPLSEGPGTVIGPYKLLEQIGEGGMGVVYMAEQTKPGAPQGGAQDHQAGHGHEAGDRPVRGRAPGPGADGPSQYRPGARRRRHRIGPPLLRDGAGQGHPDHRLLRPQPSLPIDDRLGLFVQVCQAVQHAHQKGIIHRDLKPSNVLVTLIDGAAVPKVIDFGVAKAMGQQLTEKTLFTGFAQLIGTPLYMSPEQAEFSGVDVDTRSDIYALGVLLYELLTGTTPFDQETFRTAAYDEIRRIIREEEPPRPSTRLSTLEATATTVSANRQSDPRTLGKLMRGELDWIVMKALEKDRNRRYETASGLAADVRRYLADEPVEACPPSAWYRFGKSARRNRAALITAGLVGFALVAGTVVSTWQAIRATRAERKIAAAFELAETRRAEADAQRGWRKTARGWLARPVDDMYIQFAWTELPWMSQVQRAFLEKAMAYYQKFAEEEGTNPEVRIGVARAYRTMGKMHEAMGDSAKAEEAVRRALDISKELVDQFPGVPSYREHLATCYNSWGNTLRDPREREQAYRRSLAIWEDLAAEPADCGQGPARAMSSVPEPGRTVRGRTPTHGSGTCPPPVHRIREEVERGVSPRLSPSSATSNGISQNHLFAASSAIRRRLQTGSSVVLWSMCEFAWCSGAGPGRRGHGAFSRKHWRAATTSWPRSEIWLDESVNAHIIL